MREIIHLPLGRTLEQRAWADQELNDMYAEYDAQSVRIVGVYVDAMDYSAQPIMVIVVTKESE